jgi:carbamoylphosphate synthase small subunit
VELLLVKFVSIIGMTGYQEIFTDPSYYGQLMVATMRNRTYK